jgi:hypothetical protein
MKERVGIALTILVLTGVSFFFAGLSLGLYTDPTRRVSPYHTGRDGGYPY